MNYYNPYFYSIPSAMAMPRMGLFRSLFSGFNFSSVLNGTQRALNIVNQTIPLVKQAKPVLKNAKTMFKVMNEFKKSDNIKNENIQTNEKDKEKASQNVGPTFFA